MNVWIVLATYGPEDDIEPVLVAAFSKEDAEKAIEETLDEVCKETGSRDEWIVGEAFEQPILGIYQPPEPAWRSSIFTDDEANTIFECTMDEVRDSIKDITKEECDKLDMVDCIAFIDEDPEGTAELLYLVKTGHICREDMMSEHEDHIKAAKLCDRMGLMNDQGEVTDLGVEYIERWRAGPTEPIQPQPLNGTVH